MPVPCDAAPQVPLPIWGERRTVPRKLWPSEAEKLGTPECVSQEGPFPSPEPEATPLGASCPSMPGGPPDMGGGWALVEGAPACLVWAL